MADWLKVFKLAPGAVVVLVNERREQPAYGDNVIRSELRCRGRIVISHHQQSSAEDLERNFAELNFEMAAQWVINTAKRLKEETSHYGR
ncbi:hypothetical protein QSV36_03480 [Pseudomonas sp. BCRC 81390]|uniref:hypothetical protein n=1 Tax=Pseudomonas sp. BCRC 81390 TaxID=3054778 RepID=UPI00259A9098|nr:hypothetical protein [Pseudomonas sp. BCRC 81390]MDM3884659.1 hypothetical protein [Pseudomonas sp. BCRC 81390]